MFWNLTAVFVKRGALLIRFSLHDFSRRNVGSNIVTFLLPSSTLQRLSTPSIESWENLDALHIFSPSYGNSILVWVPASCREEKCLRVLWTQELIRAGVKQGRVRAPVVFNLFLVAVTLVFRHNLSAADGVRIKCRIDGSLFNVRRFQAVPKVTKDTFFDLQYAAALPSHTPDGLQLQQSLLHTLVQDWSLTPKPRKSFWS